MNLLIRAAMVACDWFLFLNSQWFIEVWLMLKTVHNGGDGHWYSLISKCSWWLVASLHIVAAADTGMSQLMGPSQNQLVRKENKKPQSPHTITIHCHSLPYRYKYWCLRNKSPEWSCLVQRTRRRRYTWHCNVAGQPATGGPPVILHLELTFSAETGAMFLLVDFMFCVEVVLLKFLLFHGFCICQSSFLV